MKRLKRLNVLPISVVLVILLALVWLVGGKSGSDASAQSVTPTPDNSLARIQEAGTLVVGTSLPYEPFEYFASFFRLDGFDIAVMEEIGRRMGVEVTFRDYAFEGLFGALSLDQIDAAIAAITVTPHRARMVEFSLPYYQGAGTALTAADSTVAAITRPADLTELRIGVERGTVYETWLRKVYIRAGLGSSANIFTYKNPDGAVRDLKAERLDIVLLDLPVAENYVDEGGVKLVALTEPTQDVGVTVQPVVEAVSY